jgi:NAD(P)-dependent dehydrogenase (short-subunit alcohol dehydrogenase family)
MNAFKNKIAVVTGANSGIGFAAARQFKEQQAVVIITGRRKEPLKAAAAKLNLADYYESDQSKLGDIDTLVKDISLRYDKVDILVINAGVATFQPIAQTTELAFDQMMSINFKGAFFTIQKFLPILNDGASVVLISSNGATMARPGTAVYAASKAALNAVAKIAAVELAPRKIRVNTISPGPTETEMVNKFGFDEQTLKGMKQAIVQQVPLSKIGDAKDVAEMILFLSNPETASFITGGDFVIDGGMKLK